MKKIGSIYRHYANRKLISLIVIFTLIYAILPVSSVMLLKGFLNYIEGVSQTQLAEDLGIGKQSISDYEKQKSYPTFANLDKIAEYFNATPTQLFGTSKEIELEKSVLESNEYSDKVSEILKAIKYIEHFLQTDGQYLEDLLYLTRGSKLYTEDGNELYIDPTSQKRTFHNQYEPGFIVARDKSPLELLIENKELLD